MLSPTTLDVLVRYDAQAGWWIDTGAGPVGCSYALLTEATLIAHGHLRDPRGRVLVQAGTEWAEVEPPVLLDAAQAPVPAPRRRTPQARPSVAPVIS